MVCLGKAGKVRCGTDGLVCFGKARQGKAGVVWCVGVRNGAARRGTAGIKIKGVIITWQSHGLKEAASRQKQK